MKKVVYFLIAIIFVSCSSSGPEVTKDDESVKKKRKAVREKTDVMMDELNEESGEKKDNLIAQKPTAKDINPRSEPNIQIPDSARKIESEIKRNKDNYYYGENEGDDYETVKEKSKTELIENIMQFITSTRVRETSDINDSNSDIFKISSSSFSMMKLYNLKSIDVKPKTGGNYRVITYITLEDLKKSNEQTENEILGLLKEAENLEILNNNLYDAVPQFYKAYLKSQTSIFEIKYNSNSLGEVSAKNYAEQKVRKYLDEIILKSEPGSIKYIESDEQFEIPLRLDYKGKVLNNIKVKTESGGFRRVASNKVNLFEVYQDLSQLKININCLISPYIEFAENDILKIIENDFGVITNKTIVADFSSFVKIDFKSESVNQNAIRFSPEIKFLPVFNYSWNFSDGAKSTDERPLKILPENFTGWTITFILNNNEKYKVIKELTKNKTLKTIWKPKFSTKPTPPKVVDDTPVIITENPTPTDVKIDESFERELNLAKNGNDIQKIIEDLKDKGFLVYSSNPRNFPNIESCYLIVIVGKDNLQILKPGTQLRYSLKGNVVDINTISKIIYYIKII